MKLLIIMTVRFLGRIKLMNFKKCETQKNIFMFPGIGTNYKECLSKFEKDFEQQILKKNDIVKEILGVGFLDESCKDELNTWILSYTCDYLVAMKYKKMNIEADYLLGFSLGVITAAAFSEAIMFEDGVRILYDIANYRIQATEELIMITIGFSVIEVENLIEKYQLENKVFVACINNKYCVTVAGKKSNILYFRGILVELGIMKVNIIESKYAFHTRLMKENIEQLSEDISKVRFFDSEIPMISVIDGKVKNNGYDIKEELVKNLYSVLDWKTIVEKFSEDKEIVFYEAGLGKTMIKSARVILPEKTYINLHNVDKIV